MGPCNHNKKHVNAHKSTPMLVVWADGKVDSKDKSLDVDTSINVCIRLSVKKMFERLN